MKWAEFWVKYKKILFCLLFCFSIYKVHANEKNRDFSKNFCKINNCLFDKICKFMSNGYCNRKSILLAWFGYFWPTYIFHGIEFMAMYLNHQINDRVCADNKNCHIFSIVRSVRWRFFDWLRPSIYYLILIVCKWHACLLSVRQFNGLLVMYNINFKNTQTYSIGRFYLPPSINGTTWKALKKHDRKKCVQLEIQFKRSHLNRKECKIPKNNNKLLFLTATKHLF